MFGIRYKIIGFLLFLLLPIFALGDMELKTSLYSWDPYQYTRMENGQPVLTGLDTEIVRHLAKLLHTDVDIESNSWEENLEKLKNGELDFLPGASFDEDRAQFAYYSAPYRYEQNALFVRKEDKDKYNFSTAGDMLAYIKKNNFKLGVVKGFVYVDPEVNAFIKDPLNANSIVYGIDDKENLKNLLLNNLDGFLGDTLVGTTVTWREEKENEVSEIPLEGKTPIYFVLSKRSAPSSLLTQVNQSIKTMKVGQEYSKIVSGYLYPVLLLQVLDSEWFFIIELIGTVAFAISGLLIAYREKLTFFGACVMAILPSFGGGVVRDVIVDRSVSVMVTPIYIQIVILTVCLGFVFLKLRKQYNKKFKNELKEPHKYLTTFNSFVKHALVVTDALGLAAFTVVGVLVGGLVRADPLWLWGPLFAVLTGAGGGMIRDLFRKDRMIQSMEGPIYPEIAIIWGLFLSIAWIIISDEIHPRMILYAVIATLAGAFVTRLLVYYYKVPNLKFD